MNSVLLCKQAKNYKEETFWAELCYMLILTGYVMIGYIQFILYLCIFLEVTFLT